MRVMGTQEVHSEDGLYGMGHGTSPAPALLGGSTTYIQAGHVHPVAYNHIDEFIWGAVFSEKHFCIEDL